MSSGNNNHLKTIIVGMSGGVDSSVSAYLIKQQGYRLAGLFMKNWEEDDNEKYCSTAVDLADAKSVCNQLNIELYTVNFAAEYWNKVFEYFLSEYRIGRTPNPDIICNKEIKFKMFLEFATKNLSADYIATGHYVRRKTVNGSQQLLRGVDNNKDQSYFLHVLDQIQLTKSIFPIGEMEKSSVRHLATKLGFTNANKKDSTGICFIGKRNFREFIKKYLPANPGAITTVDGKIVGKHAGLMYYTLGQRKGLGIGGRKQANMNHNHCPWYVVDKNIANNTLIVAQGHNNQNLMSNGIIIKKIHWINSSPISANDKYHCTVKTRYRQQDIQCILTRDKNAIIVKFHYPVAAVTPGQFAVFYQGEVCLGGGMIEKLVK